MFANLICFVSPVYPPGSGEMEVFGKLEWAAEWFNRLLLEHIFQAGVVFV